jgi:hypothetical protein
LRIERLIGFLVILSFVNVACSDNAAERAAAQELAQRAIGKVSMKAQWERIEVTEAKRKDYTLRLIYRSPPSNSVEVVLDTQSIARAVLTELVASGSNPSRDHASVWVWAQRPVGGGETGAPLVQVYGHTEYNYNNDQLTFEPWKP